MIHKDAKIPKSTKLWYPELSNIGACTIGEHCTIHSHVWIGNGVFIGHNVKIQAFTFIPDGVTIGDNVFIGPRVTFTNDKNPPGNPNDWLPTVVESGASLGASVTVLPGVVIKKNARVGAGAVVTKDVQEDTLVVGVPARALDGGVSIPIRVLTVGDEMQ